MHKLVGLVSAGILAAGLCAGMAGTAYAEDPTNPAFTWNEINFPFMNGNGIPLCLDVPGGSQLPANTKSGTPTARCASASRTIPPFR
jgi:hypothetical protein